MNIKIKYLNNEITKLNKLEQGDWIDLRISEVFILNKGGDKIPAKRNYNNDFIIRKDDVVVIKFGVALELPKGYEAIISSRSSLFKKHRLLLTNGIGVVDNAYNGDEDEWQGVFLATSYSQLCFNERVCQFRIQENMPEVIFEEVEELGNAPRGGYGSTDILDDESREIGPVEVIIDDVELPTLKPTKRKPKKKVEKVVDTNVDMCYN
jgi:dUTP pyrophosphatase